MERVADRLFSGHALTHVHPDHQGASHAVCAELGVPLWVDENDADAMENAEVMAERTGGGAATVAQRSLFIGLAELKPAVVCFGHGPPLRDPGALRAVAERQAS